MSDLVKAYSEYYSEPNEENSEALASAIKAYDFSNYESDIAKLQELVEETPELEADPQDDIFKILADQTIVDKVTVSSTFMALSSNGSTTPLVNYRFGPNVDYWKKMVEAETRQDNGEPVVNLLKDNIKTIDKKYDKSGPVRVEATSANLLHPTTNPNLSDWLYNNRHKIASVTNMNWEPFYKKEFLTDTYFNDQMVDWKTGVNFYTCEYGYRHTLPIWIEIDGKHVNLLNMKFLHAPISDYIDIQSFSPCECGGMKCDMTFVPHYQHSIKNEEGDLFYNVNMIESLKGCYHRLQFLQDPLTNKVSIYMMPDGKVNANDIDLIREELERKNLEHELVLGKWFMVGRSKAPNFWRGSTDNIKLFSTVKPLMLL